MGVPQTYIETCAQAPRPKYGPLTNKKKIYMENANSYFVVFLCKTHKKMLAQNQMAQNTSVKPAYFGRGACASFKQLYKKMAPIWETFFCFGPKILSFFFHIS